MKTLYTLAFLFIISTGAFAQNYFRDVGVSFGEGTRFSYRLFYKENLALNFYAGYRENGFRIGGQRHFVTEAFTGYSENLKLYYGYGVHAGFSYINHHSFAGREYNYSWVASPVFGFDGVCGIEYYFPEVPFLVSCEVKPYFEYSVYRVFRLKPLDVSFSLRYRF